MDKNNYIQLAGLTPESVVDGLGIRFVIWTQGCGHACPGCHSPATWDFQGGRRYNLNQLLQQISLNPLLKGITLSGGDPMEQPKPLIYLCQQVKKNGLDVWCYTGYTWDKLLDDPARAASRRNLLSYIDVLVDGKFELAQKDPQLAFRGSRNQRIIDVSASLKQNKVVLLAID